MPSFVPVGNLWGSRIYRMIRRRQRSKTALRDIPVCYILRKSRWLVKHYSLILCKQCTPKAAHRTLRSESLGNPLQEA